MGSIPMSRENTECEDHYAQTTSRRANGTYEVKIPFKTPKSDLGESRPRAMARFLQLEKKLCKPGNEELRKMYNSFMEEYLALGHMKDIDTQERANGKYYIPHQPVLRMSSTTTKLRVVFDASTKTSNGQSLNDIMHTGPRLQQELMDILLRWRKYPIAFCADIEKMYRQIKINAENQAYQRILWRFDQKKPIEEYSLTTVTYGTAAAPYLAVKTLQKLAKDERLRFPRGSERALEDFYVDDLLSGADSIEEAIQIQTEITDMLKSGGFNLRKWSSNKQEVLANVLNKSDENSVMEITEDGVHKALGVYWAPNTDTFQFKVENSIPQKVTKRTILSEIAKIFDPLGWLSPVVITEKMLMQELWVQELEWDKPVPDSILVKSTNLQAKMKQLEDIKIPRWIQHSSKVKDVEMHGFCDASEKAYGAVIYIRVLTQDNKTNSTILVAKSKVAPARTKVCLPRLELCAAVLLSKLMTRAKQTLKIPDIKQVAWSDSMITLAWVKGDPARWSTFVANRVSEINNNVPADQWYHVKTMENPADVISRGICPSKLKDLAIWWEGPNWLKNNTVILTTVKKLDTDLERKRKVQAAVAVKKNNCDIIDRFSNLNKAIRVISYCNRMRRKVDIARETNSLTVVELQQSMKQLIRMTQAHFFITEINALKQGENVNKNSKILSFNPFLDDNGILHVGGRLANSSLPFDQKHPSIIPGHSHLATLIIRDAHHLTMHGGNQLTMTQIRQKYWITNGKNVVRSLIHKCPTCIRFKAETRSQLMGNLPAPRVNPAPPFSNAGVDYAGPIAIRVSKGRGNKSYKGYIALFVCLATKAIHLEAVSDMTSEAFLAAFRRFTSRRGHCHHMYSDNGTNFVGANNILQDEVHDIFRDADMQDKLVTRGTQWHFIPPSAPHFGGLWEAGVKSMKFHLKRVIGTATLTFEELSTLLCQIEACLNSRPLCAISNDADNVEILTPGHFLIGREVLATHHPAILQMSVDLGTRWKAIQKMKKDFWHSWTSEYLHKLQQRTKWQISEENPNVGDIVIIKEKDINPTQWPLARITSIQPGQDAKVRVVTVKKADGKEMKRAINYLVPLTLQSNKDIPKTESTSANLTRSYKPKNNAQAASPSKFKALMLLWIFIATVITRAEASYVIKNLSPGLYVEHIGHARVERGIFRVEVNYDIRKLHDDIRSVNNVTRQFYDLCDQMKAMASGAQCHSLLHHLEELNKEIQWIQASIEYSSSRKKRGMLGNLMTAVFGVNDEVYHDIDKLESNQRQLINSANHQTKFMLSAIKTFNETEERISKRLEQFRVKLNQGLKIVNEMRGWGASDPITLNIHILNVYQTASNFVEDTIRHYSKLLNVRFGRGSLHELLSPAQVNQLIAEANQKIPSTLSIIPDPILKTTVEIDGTNIRIFGQFLLAGISNFTLMKITPIPLKMENQSYWITSIHHEIIAVDYNLQLYFEMQTKELSSGIQLKDNNYIYAPGAIQNIETNSNCLIDEIYERSNPLKCEVIRNSIHGTIWKELHSNNAWMAIVPTPIKIAIACNGERQDVLLNQTCIVRISQDCIIKTKQNILTPKRINAAPITASFFKAVQPENITFPRSRKKGTIPLIEPVLKNSENLNSLLDEETEIDTELKTTNWHVLNHHSIISSALTTAIIIVIAITLLFVYKRYRGYFCKASTTNKQTTPVQEEEMVELQPLYSAPFIRPAESRQNVQA